MRSRWPTTLLMLSLAWAGSLSAQSESGVELLAGVLALEDARRFDESPFRRAFADRDSSVRSHAALGLGRLRDPRGVPLLAPLLLDSDPSVQSAAIFALGILGDSSASPLLLGRAKDPAPLATTAAVELVTAVARLGGADGSAFLNSLLQRTFWNERADADRVVQRAAQDAWRLGPRAPVAPLLGLSRDEREDIRFAAIYSLTRLRTVEAVPRFMEAAGDASASVRGAAVRGLVRSLVDSAGAPAETAIEVLVRATTDRDAGVRVNALRTIATYREPKVAGKLVPLLDDPVPNVQVQAASALGELGGVDALESLSRIATGSKGSFARRREALLGLARLDSAAFSAAAGGWTASRDWRERAASAEGWARVNPASLDPWLRDQDPRVVAAALQAWGARLTGGDSRYLEACRPLARHRDAAVRSIVADGLGRGANRADLPLLLEMYRLATRDSFPDAAQSALGAMVAIARASPGSAQSIERSALAALPAPDSYLIRLWAETNWPTAAGLWGPAYPLATGRTLEDYRDIARRLLLGPDHYPRVRLDVDQVGIIELELFGPDAPLTVASFLRLVDQRYFDGQRFHRVVPNFVVQAGDPRGDGWGGPGGALRDELNPRRYEAYTVGMALSGPDTGGSQWFITLSQQPHLDGGYTVFGEVKVGVPALLRVTQGDLIRSIRR